MDYNCGSNISNGLTAEDIFDVEAILDKRWNKTDKAHEYLIKWLNYSDEYNEWIADCDLVKFLLLFNVNKIIITEVK